MVCTSGHDAVVQSRGRNIVSKSEAHGGRWCFIGWNGVFHGWPGRWGAGLLDVLEHLGTFSVLIAVIFYFADSGNRRKQKHYQAWQVINTAQGKGGSGGRIEALQ